MTQIPLTPAAQAVLDALRELGQGDVHELADKSGRARSTTDKAIKTLADSGLIVPVDPDSDPADGAPMRWRLAEPREADSPDPADATASDAQTIAPDEAEPAVTDLAEPADAPDPDDSMPLAQAGDDDVDDGPDPNGDENGTGTADPAARDEGRAVAAPPPVRPGDRKVMAIKGVLADYGEDGAPLDVIVAESGIGQPSAVRLLTAMEQADAARRLPGPPERWIAGPTKASEVDPNPQPPRCPLCYQAIRAAMAPGAAAAVRPLVRSDGTLHIVGPDGETHVVTLPTSVPPRAHGVGRVEGRSDTTVNADGSQPFNRGELEKLTLDVLAANPGRAMTPQEIATAIGAQLGRTVSSGAVRNNCTKAAAAGRIVMVSDAPLTFAHPAQADDANATASETGDSAQP